MKKVGEGKEDVQLERGREVVERGWAWKNARRRKMDEERDGGESTKPNFVGKCLNQT